MLTVPPLCLPPNPVARPRPGPSYRVGLITSLHKHTHFSECISLKYLTSLLLSIIFEIDSIAVESKHKLEGILMGPIPGTFPILSDLIMLNGIFNCLVKKTTKTCVFYIRYMICVGQQPSPLF